MTVGCEMIMGEGDAAAGGRPSGVRVGCCVITGVAVAVGGSVNTISCVPHAASNKVSANSRAWTFFIVDFNFLYIDNE